MTTSELRVLLREILRTDAELDAFCMDNFPAVHHQFTEQMDRVQKENLLLTKVPPDVLHRHLADERAHSAVLAGASSYGAALGAALRLDRTVQWHDIVETSREPGSIIYLLFGQRERAGLTFFVDRVCRFLAPEQGDRHRIFKVPFQADGIGARTGEDWALRLQTELATHLGRRGEVELRELLRLATARQPFFILLGRFPLPPLDESEQAGLEEFLADLLPGFLRDVPYVRILLAHDYEKPAQSLATKLDGWMRQGAASGKYQFMPLDEAVLPSWDDVYRYLSRHKQLAAERIAALKPEYERLRSRKTLSYEALATFLDRKLDTPDEVARLLPTEVWSQGMALRRNMDRPLIPDSHPARRYPKPLVVITSNVERQLPDAFLRRCVFFHIEFPARDRLTAILSDHLRDSVDRLNRPGGELVAESRRFIEQKTQSPERLRSVRAELPEAAQAFLEAVLDVFLRLRSQPLTKRPATAELISWGRALLGGASAERHALAIVHMARTLRAEQGTSGLACERLPQAGCLIKLREDWERLRPSRPVQ